MSTKVQVEAMKVTWDAAGARRMERQFPTTPAASGTPVADVMSAMLGAHAQVLPAAEASAAIRTADATRADVRAALWDQRRRGRRTTIAVEPVTALTARQERELGKQVDRVGEVLEARPELALGKVTVGPHA